MNKKRKLVKKPKKTNEKLVLGKLLAKIKRAFDDYSKFPSRDQILEWIKQIQGYKNSRNETRQIRTLLRKFHDLYILSYAEIETPKDEEEHWDILEEIRKEIIES